MPSIIARLTINGKITTKLFAKIQSFSETMAFFPIYFS